MASGDAVGRVPGSGRDCGARAEPAARSVADRAPSPSMRTGVVFTTLTCSASVVVDAARCPLETSALATTSLVPTHGDGADASSRRSAFPASKKETSG